MQDNELVADIGRALYGDHWKSDLARALNVNIRAVQRWHKGNRVPDSVWADLALLVESRHNEINQLLVVLYGKVQQG